MANHSYLTPKDETDPISCIQLIRGLRACFNVNLLGALFLTFAATIRCGNIWSVSFSQLCKHNVIEHDGSITRPDIESGKDYRNFEQSRLDAFLKNLDRPEMISVQDWSLERCVVESQMPPPTEATAAGRKGRLSQTDFLGRGEAGLVMAAFSARDWATVQNGGAVRRDWLEELWTYERLPATWKPPQQAWGIKYVLEVVSDMKERMARIRQSRPDLRPCASYHPDAKL